MSEGEAAARCGACPAHADGPGSRAAYAGCGVGPVSAFNVPFTANAKVLQRPDSASSTPDERSPLPVTSQHARKQSGYNRNVSGLDH